MLEDAQPPVVLTQERLLASLPAHGAQMVCLDAHWPHDCSMSATTTRSVGYQLTMWHTCCTRQGRQEYPKGVLGVHRATLNVLAWMWQAFPFAAHEVCCQKTSMSFGDSIQELLGPLLRGVRTVLIPDEVLKDLPRFVQTLARHRVTRLILVPSLLRTLLDTYHDLPASTTQSEALVCRGRSLVERSCATLPAVSAASAA